VTYTNETRTKEVSYTYNVPEVTQEAYEVTRNDTVCEDEVEEYTVSVPVCVMKEVQVQVCKMVPRLVEEVITPCSSGSAGMAAGAGCGSGDCGAATTGCGGCGAAATPVATGCGCN
jgi:hypothetical protein